MRFGTAPSRSRKWVSDAYSIRSGAVTNRTYRVGAKRLQTAPTGLELSGYKPHLPGLEVPAPDPVKYVQDKGFRERIGAVTNRTISVNLRKYLSVYEPFSMGMVIETVLYLVP